MDIIKVTYQRSSQPTWFIVDVNFELPNPHNMSSAAQDWLLRMRQLAGVEQISLGGRYRLCIEIGQHFAWEAVWPHVERLMRWLAVEQQARDAKQVDAALGGIEAAVNARDVRFCLLPVRDVFDLRPEVSR